MKTLPYLLLLAAACAACFSPSQDCCAPEANYLPLAVGNYWKVDDNDYLEVTGKARLDDGEYFVLSSYIRDAPDPALVRQTIYLRLDDQQRLIQGFSTSNWTRIWANFALQPGQEVTAFDRITALVKTADRMKFRYECLICSSLPNQHEATFLNGRGFAERNFFLAGNLGLVKPFREARINGVVYAL
jgi:hypothetical protein